jgi:hypothetical protein
LLRSLTSLWRIEEAWLKMSKPEEIDHSTFAPFIFLDKDGRCQLLLLDSPMLEKFAVFQEREGWLGNGYDWASVARTVVAEQLPHLQDVLSFHPEAGMFIAYGPRAAVQNLGTHMRALFRDNGKLRDILSRSKQS